MKAGEIDQDPQHCRAVELKHRIRLTQQLLVFPPDCQRLPFLIGEPCANPTITIEINAEEDPPTTVQRTETGIAAENRRSS